MLNFVNNPFGQLIESSVSSGKDKHQHQQQQQKKEEKHYLNSNEKDEVSFSHSESLTESEILELTENYISRLKSENQNNEKIVKKLDNYLVKFNVKKFMKSNPNINNSDFRMVMFNETANLIF